MANWRVPQLNNSVASSLSRMASQPLSKASRHSVTSRWCNFPLSRTRRLGMTRPNTQRRSRSLQPRFGADCSCLWRASRRRPGAHLERVKRDPKIARRSVGSHENPTDSEFAVSSRSPSQRRWCRIIPARYLNRSNSISPCFPVRRNG